MVAVVLAAAASSVAAAAPAASSPGVVHLEQSLRFTGFVVDQAALLTADERARLTHELDLLQQRTGIQMAVVTVSSLGGEDVAVFTRTLANRWGVGRRGLNDGVVVLVAPNERKVRIAVGRGLEARLTHDFCADVIARRMLPKIRAGQIGAGIEAGVGAISEDLEKVR